MDDFRIRTHDGVKAIEATRLRAAGFYAGFSTRLGGVSALPADALNLGHFSGDSTENVAINRERFLVALEIPQTNRLVTAKQIHSADCHLVTSAEGERASCDGLLTNKPDLLLGIQTADCLPVLIVDAKQRAVAGVHAGWRGTLARIVERAVARLQSEFGSDPADCLAATGPAIGRCCYEVGADVCEPFQSQFSYGRELFWKHQPNGKANLDLRAANRAQLLESGLRAENISIWPDCTLCQTDLYFSYRGESQKGSVGRLLSIVGLA